MRGLLATAQVLAVAGCSGGLLLSAWFVLILTSAIKRDEKRRKRDDEPVPDHLSPDDLPSETPVETTNGGVYTISELQALQAQYTKRQWETFEALAAEYSALHMRLD